MTKSNLLKDLLPGPVDVESLGLPPGKSRDLHLFVWKHKLIWLFGIVVFFTFADQWSKQWAQGALAKERTITRYQEIDGELKEKTVTKFFPVAANEVHIIPSALSFIYRENPAAAFSLTRSIPTHIRMPLLIGVSTLAMLLLLAWYFFMRDPDAMLMTAFALILSGAIGNLIDRVTLGYVVDFINAYAGFINPKWPPWPTFNIADSCIVIGAIVVLHRAIWPLYPEKVEAKGTGDVQDSMTMNSNG
jgi:signal peptidase II